MQKLNFGSRYVAEDKRLHYLAETIKRDKIFCQIDERHTLIY